MVGAEDLLSTLTLTLKLTFYHFNIRTIYITYCAFMNYMIIHSYVQFKYYSLQ